MIFNGVAYIIKARAITVPFVVAMATRGAVKKPQPAKQLPAKANGKVVVYQEEEEEDILEDLEEAEEVEEAAEEAEEAAEEAEEDADQALVAAKRSEVASDKLVEKLDVLLERMSMNMGKTHVVGLTTTPHDRSKVLRLDVEFAASLTDLQNMQAMSLWTPTDSAGTFGSRTRWGHDCKPSKDRRGDLRNVLVQFVNIVAYDNKFPCKVAFVFPAIYHARGNWRDGTDKQYAGICFAGRNWSGKEVIMVESEYHKSEFFKKYPNYHLDNIWSQGVMHSPDQQMHLVQHQHPVLEYIVADEEGVKLVQGKEPTPVGTDFYYSIPSPHFHKAIKLLEAHGREHLPRYNLEKFMVQIVRPRNREWIDPEEVADNMQSTELVTRQMTLKHRLTLHIEICYAFM